jgi:hypothetical protein
VRRRRLRLVRGRALMGTLIILTGIVVVGTIAGVAGGDQGARK